MVIFMIITKSKKPIAMVTTFALLACMVLSINLLTVKAASATTTGNYTITPSSVFDLDPDAYDNSQEVTIAVEFNAGVTVASGAEADFNVVLNGTTLSTSTGNVLYKVEQSTPGSNIVNIVLWSNPTNLYPGSSMSGNFFALRMGQCSITPTSGTTLSHIKDAATGLDSSTWTLNMTGLTLHTGYELHQISSTPSDGISPASVSYDTGSLAQVRGITWMHLLKNGVEVPFGTNNGTSYPILTVGGTDHYFALHCHDFQNGDNDYYLDRIYQNMTVNYTDLTDDYDIDYDDENGVLTITQKEGTFEEDDTLSLEIYYSPDIP
jgi:hypothetical protein